MEDRDALALRHMDVVFNKNSKTLSRVDSVHTDKAGRAIVALFGLRFNHDAMACALALVYRAESIPPGAYVRLGPVRDGEHLAAIRQAIQERQQEDQEQAHQEDQEHQEDQDRERNGENIGQE